mmetsp:Transcript_5291/g.33239  ORF Transcript_5291/g.33239 Transcript_5291/m.33239 type:complete len:146 (+) Transcript_5291:1505-1942(+)
MFSSNLSLLALQIQQSIHVRQSTNSHELTLCSSQTATAAMPLRNQSYGSAHAGVPAARRISPTGDWERNFAAPCRCFRAPFCYPSCNPFPRERDRTPLSTILQSFANLLCVVAICAKPYFDMQCATGTRIVPPRPSLCQMKFSFM